MQWSKSVPVVGAGEYQNASEAIRDALRALQQRRKEDSLRLKALRAQIKAGVDALDPGEFAEVDDADLQKLRHRLRNSRVKSRTASMKRGLAASSSIALRITAMTCSTA
jgi:antitoxin ParD1/3/4